MRQDRRADREHRIRCQFWTELWSGPDGEGCTAPAVTEMFEGHGNSALVCAYHHAQLKIDRRRTAEGLGLVLDDR